MCRAIVLLLTVTMTAELLAQTAQRAVLPVKVNETSRGEILSYIDGQDIFVARSFLEDLKIPLTSATTRTIDGETFVSLQSLAPKLTYTFNPNEVTLSIVADPSLLGTRVLDLQRTNLAADRGGDRSLFVNYALLGQRTSTPGLFTEVGASEGNRFAYSGLTRTASGDLLRGLSYVNFESPAALQRVTVGDSFASTDLLGGAVMIGGVTVSRQYSLQPYLVRTPGLDVSGAATTPSTVDVYVNGQLTNRIQVQPGIFTLHDLPVTGGLGDTRLVIRDAFGRETVQEGSFYYSSIALRRGFSDYTFSVGKLRNDLTKSFAYGEAAGLAQYRRGLTDRVTAGGRVEVSPHMFSAGPSLTLGTRAGDLDMQVAASSADGTAGSAGSLSYRFSAPRYSFGLRALERSSRYTTLSLSPAMDRALRDWSLFAATAIRRVSVGLIGTRTDLRDGGTFDSLALQGTTPVGRWGSLFTSIGTARRNGTSQPEVLLGLTIAVGRTTTVSAQLQRSQGRDGTRFEVRKPLAFSNGYGFSVATDSLTNSQLASLQYQSSYGRYELSTDAKNPKNTTYDIAGGVVFLGGTIRPTRPIDDGFALARVGVPGVEVYASNQPIGRTDRTGDLLISHLLPHYNNELRISDKDVPIEYVVEGTQVIAVPPTRGGVIVTFPVHRLHSYSGKVSFLIIGRPFSPSLGEVIVDRAGGEPLVLSLGRGGEFYVEDLDPGTYKARLRIGRVHCDFSLVLPRSDAALTDLGVIPCAP